MPSSYCSRADGSIFSGCLGFGRDIKSKGQSQGRGWQHRQLQICGVHCKQVQDQHFSVEFGEAGGVQGEEGTGGSVGEGIGDVHRAGF